MAAKEKTPRLDALRAMKDGDLIVKAGDPCEYRCLAGDVYKAIVTGLPAPGFVNIDVQAQGTDKPVPLRAVRWAPERLGIGHAGPVRTPTVSRSTDSPPGIDAMGGHLCPSCDRVFRDGETCTMGGCPMGGDL